MEAKAEAFKLLDPGFFIPDPGFCSPNRDFGIQIYFWGTVDQTWTDGANNKIALFGSWMPEPFSYAILEFAAVAISGPTNVMWTTLCAAGALGSLTFTACALWHLSCACLWRLCAASVAHRNSRVIAPLSGHWS